MILTGKAFGRTNLLMLDKEGKNIDACTMTNMEALDMPAASGVPTTSILVGDYSNGNDAVLARNGVGLKDLGGKKLLLVQKTVSEYLLDRAMTITDVKLLEKHGGKSGSFVAEK